jgi:7-cyano-7-deazaguanine synthase in queuosine biosynthesis
MSRNVVIYSGGLDSTAILYMAGMFSSKLNPVVTISVKDHYRGNPIIFRMQSIARRKYIKWAKSIGHFIEPYEIAVSGNAIGNTDLREYHCWAGLIPTYLQAGDNVSWGIKKYEFNHIKGMKEYLESFNTFFRVSCGIDPINHMFPLRDIGNSKLNGIMKEFKIPPECMYNCAHPKKNGRPCAHCDKCDCMVELCGPFPEPKPRKSIN